MNQEGRSFAEQLSSFNNLQHAPTNESEGKNTSPGYASRPGGRRRRRETSR